MTATVNAPAPRRTLILVVLVAALVAAAVADRAGRGDEEVSVAADEQGGTAPPVGALASTWFCPLATAVGGGQANGTVVIANPTRAELSGTVTVVSSDRTRKSKAVTVGPRARIEVRQQDVLEASYAAALVEMDGGGAVVEQAVAGPLGESVAACSASASPRWYIADGATTRAASLLIGLFNPFPDDAIVDLSFSTNEGLSGPAAYKPVTVPPQALVVLDIGEQVHRRTNIAASIVARRGRIVASKIQVHDGEGRKGLAAALAAPAPAEDWYFPDGVVVPGITERFHVYNPTQREARVVIEFTLDEDAVEPFERAIPARGRVTVSATDEERVPHHRGHSTAVRSLNDVAVVAERSVDAVAPAPRAGFATTLGARTTARQWLFAAGAADEGHDEWIAVNNVGRRDARVSIAALASGQTVAIDGMQDIELKGGRRAALRLGDKIRRSDLTVLVTSTEEIVVERSLFRVGGLGLSIVPGTILRD